ncbi:hypothetical protein L835_1866 [Mycobacteroides abscessus MAB_110811_1470]|nr:hypothetical protein L835_1866 [Mycobacteroides abscessus MAB_110811_1470]
MSGFDFACAAALVGFQRRTPAAVATGVADLAAHLSSRPERFTAATGGCVMIGS